MSFQRLVFVSPDGGPCRRCMVSPGCPLLLLSAGGTAGAAKALGGSSEGTATAVSAAARWGLVSRNSKFAAEDSGRERREGEKGMFMRNFLPNTQDLAPPRSSGRGHIRKGFKKLFRSPFPLYFSIIPNSFASFRVTS